MERKTTVNEYQFIFELFRLKDRELQEILNNLKIEDVKEEKAFLRTKEKVKAQIIVNPIHFKEPKISNHRSELRNIDPYINPLGGQRQVTIAEVEFSFDGSPELFGYRPESVSYSDPTVYLPVGKSVKVDVLTERLEKAAVLLQSNQQMRLTFDLINSINTQVESWSKGMEQQIDDRLQIKRKELIEFYS